ncbi:hypothetical protein DEO72_LG11g1976 [Vigna unguiculata]|uniref:Secreted protein n=1 Tax=Vigna unguiculata TaxID=3917 RepID=A0A4D6NNQ3_VIGUN|nr:hypothetical protein DEO72_LG11g1976 [Vigna unguiculata]
MVVCGAAMEAIRMVTVAAVGCALQVVCVNGEDGTVVVLRRRAAEVGGDGTVAAGVVCVGGGAKQDGDGVTAVAGEIGGGGCRGGWKGN